MDTKPSVKIVQSSSEIVKSDLQNLYKSGESHSQKNSNDKLTN